LAWPGEFTTMPRGFAEPVDLRHRDAVAASAWRTPSSCSRP
jgi:hypothetical protein